MKVKAKKEMAAAEVDMTPMIDMTFQLIAFFMVLINFTEADQDDRVKLPLSELAKPPDVPLDNPLTLNVAKSGAIYLAGQQYGINDLNAALSQERELIRLSGENPSEVTVIIRAHIDAKTGDVQEVIKVCQQANFEQFALRAQEKVN